MQDLQRRVAALEQATQNLAPANVRLLGAGVSSPATGAPPTITGLRSKVNLSLIRISFDATNISNLRNYEIQYSTHFDFSVDAVTIDTTNLYVDIPNAQTGSTSYFVRGRIINLAGKESPWTATLNTSTGLVGSLALAPNSATNVGITIISSGFTQLQNNGDFETYGPFSVNTPVDGVLIFPYFEITTSIGSSFSGGITNNIELEFLRNNVVTQTRFIDFFSTGVPTSRTSFAAFSVPFIEATQGTFQYKIRITLNINAGAGTAALNYLASAVRAYFDQRIR